MNRDNDFIGVNTGVRIELPTRDTHGRRPKPSVIMNGVDITDTCLSAVVKLEAGQVTTAVLEVYVDEVVAEAEADHVQVDEVRVIEQ